MNENVFILAKVLSFRCEKDLLFVDLSLLLSGKQETFVLPKDEKNIKMIEVGKIFYLHVSSNLFVVEMPEGGSISYRRVIILYEKVSNNVGFSFKKRGDYWINPGDFVTPSDNDKELVNRFLALFPNYQKHKKCINNAVKLLNITQDIEVFDTLLTLSPVVLDKVLNIKGATLSVIVARQLVKLAILGLIIQRF